MRSGPGYGGWTVRQVPEVQGRIQVPPSSAEPARLRSPADTRLPIMLTPAAAPVMFFIL